MIYVKACIRNHNQIAVFFMNLYLFQLKLFQDKYKSSRPNIQAVLNDHFLEEFQHSPRLM